MTFNSIIKTSLFLLCFYLLVPSSSIAHAPDQNYVYLQVTEGMITCRVEINKNDIQKIFGYNFKPGELPDQDDPRMQKINEYIKEHLKFSSDLGDHNFTLTNLDIRKITKGDFLLFNYSISNLETYPGQFDIIDEIFLNEIDNHESLVLIEYNWKTGVLNNESLPSLIFTSANTRQSLDLEDGSILTGFLAMVKSGIYHIWIGLDHILFLIAILIPSVIIYNTRAPKKKLFGIPYTSFDPVDKFRSALISVVKIITLFTLAHTITLSLAALDVITLPSRLVETLIALSIALAAYHNIKPFLMQTGEWLIIAIFGLFHGFGFASVLAEQARGGDYLVYSLLGFNLGVEIGQLVIILIAFPILFMLSKWARYNLVVVGFSILLILISMYWIIERAFGVNFHVKKYLVQLLS